MFTDRVMTCVDCGQEFSFTAGEQEFFQQRGFTEPPKRCASCRALRKAQRDGGTGAGGWAASGDGDADRRPARPMHEAPCASCGRTAYLPFEPTGARPVYCSDCFQTRRS